jgi:hypothetical protein
MMSEFDHLYKPARKYFCINNGDSITLDPDLKPVVIQLPAPPKDNTKFKNYGLHPDEQVYRRDVIPIGLANLEREVRDSLQEFSKNHKNEQVTGYKIIEKFWDALISRAEEFKTDVLFIRMVQWKRIYGEWVYIDGRPIYIPPWFYSYLNFWSLDGVKRNGSYPEFRMRDWKTFCYNHYLYTTTETFVNRDSEGIAIASADGDYNMVDIAIRTFYGSIQPKNRRSGATHQALCCGHEIISHNSEAHFTMLSKSVSDVEDHYYKKFLTAWQRQPIILRPCWDGNNDPGGKVDYKFPANVFTGTGLRSSFGFMRVTSEGAVDSQRLHAILLDEQGKETGGGRVDVSSRWRVTKQTLSTGNGSRIHGFAFNPSTAEEMEDGAKFYYQMCKDSNFYMRDAAGQTLSGLALIYFPAQYCLEGFVDCFGNPVLNHPSERQLRLSKNDPDSVFAKLGIGSLDYLLNQRTQLLKDGSPDSLRVYREEVRKHPMRFAESWIGTTGDIGFPIEIIDKRISEGRSNNNAEKWIRRGNFKWAQGPDSTVVFEQNDNGKFELSIRLLDEYTNQKKKALIYNGIIQKHEYQYAPNNPRFVVGADPFTFDNKAKAKGRANRSSKSDGGIAAYWPFDSLVDNEESIERESDRFVLSYRYRPRIEEFNEDVLMACVWLGGWCYPENNQKSTFEHFIRRGYGGYLKYDIDPMTGNRKDVPGYWAGDSSKKEMFIAVNEYLERCGHREKHVSFLKECKDISAPDELNHYDRLAAHGAAIYGARDMMVVAKTNINQSFDIKEAYKILTGI